MYHNYEASEAVLASENMNFSQGSCRCRSIQCMYPSRLFVIQIGVVWISGGSYFEPNVIMRKMNFEGTAESYVRCVCIGYGSIVSESGTAFCIGT